MDIHGNYQIKDNEGEGENTEGPKQSKQREEKHHTKEKLAERRGKKRLIWDGTQGKLPMKGRREHRHRLSTCLEREKK